MPKPQVIVVGGGPVGLVTALGLARRGVDVTVLEREPGITRSPRAMVYHNGVLPGLERLGILDDVDRAGFRSAELAFYDHANRDAVRLDLGVMEGYEPYAYNVHLGQDRLADITLDHLQGHPGARVVFGANVCGVQQDADGVTVTAYVEGRLTTLAADYVVATDGASSPIRTSAGIEFEGHTWPERFVAANVRFDFKSLGYADSTLVVDPVMGGVIARIDEADLWRITFHEDSALPVTTVLSRIAQYFDRLLPDGADYELVQYSPYAMHQRSATTYRLGRVLLAGDAAHVTSPIGGLGLTGGLFDSYVLSEALAAVLAGSVDDSVLDEYSRLRREAFLGYASPRATDFKNLVFHISDRAKLDEVLAMMRGAAASPEVARQVLAVSQPYETPSLISEATFETSES